jgi:hypothetical protein
LDRSKIDLWDGSRNLQLLNIEVRFKAKDSGRQLTRDLQRLRPSSRQSADLSARGEVEGALNLFA